MNPTDEQLLAIEAFRTGDSLAIEAGAGTGKTSTLVLLAQDARNRRGQYVAFNKALVEDSAGKFPTNVSANTAHSLAYRAVAGRYRHRLNGPRIPAWQLARTMGIDGTVVRGFDGKPVTFAPARIAGYVSQAITRFCQSATRELSVLHFPYIDGLDAPNAVTGRRTYDNNTALATFAFPYALEFWADIVNPTGYRVPFKHEHYLKIWQLGDPRIDADFILFDEAQDANPVIADIVARQTHAQLVYVGDSQQEIYAWTGAVNALAGVTVANRTFLTQSFRFGQEIAYEANLRLAQLDAPIRLRGNPDIDSDVMALDTPRAILTRTNAMGITKLLELQRIGRRPHFLGGSADVLSFARGAEELQLKGSTGHLDLSCFDNWEAVQEYVRSGDGEDLRLMVSLVDKFGSPAIIEGLSQMPPEDRADVVISTAHKSKGRQWPSVQIASDFRAKESSDGEPRPPTPEELRLLYVAVTRAQFELDVEALTAPEGSKE